MKVNLLKLGVLALGLFVFSHVNAQEQKPKKKVAFAKLDTNSDGFLDKVEFADGMKGIKNKKGEEISAKRIEKKFEIIDSNSDGKISLEEYKVRRKKK